MEKKMFWLSFADGSKPKGQQFLGALVIDGYDFTNAIMTANIRRKNPGGEVQGVEIPEPQKSLLSPDMIGVLMTRKMIKLFDREMMKRLKSHLAETNGLLSQASSDLPEAP